MPVAAEAAFVSATVENVWSMKKICACVLSGKPMNKRSTRTPITRRNGRVSSRVKVEGTSKSLKKR